jgi:hypothetical protein
VIIRCICMNPRFQIVAGTANEHERLSFRMAVDRAVGMRAITFLAEVIDPKEFTAG